MLTFSGLIFKEFDPLGGVEKAVQKTITGVHTHPDRKNFVLKYYDKTKMKYFTVKVEDVKRVEKGAIIVQHENKKQEFFIPLHRVSEILYKGKSYWKL